MENATPCGSAMSVRAGPTPGPRLSWRASWPRSARGSASRHPKCGEPADAPPTFHEYASMWLKRRVAEGIAGNTRRDYLWQLSNHLLPFFGSYTIEELSERLVEEFKDSELDERARVVAAEQAGVVLRDADGRPRRPLSNTSINKFLVLLTRMLDAAVKRGWLAANPAGGVERLRVRRRKGGILEADELEADRRRPLAPPVRTRNTT